MTVIFTSQEYAKPRSDGGDSNKYIYYLTIDELSQDIVNNTSTLLFTLYFRAQTGTNALMWNNSSDANAPYSSILVEGVEYTSLVSDPSVDGGSANGSYYINNGAFRRYRRSTSDLPICKATLTIPHNSDGTKSISVQFKWYRRGPESSYKYYPAPFSSNGATVALTNIPRGGAISAPGSYTVGSDINDLNYTITSYANYYYNLSYTLDGHSITVLTRYNINTTTYNNSITRSWLLANNHLQSSPLVFTLETWTASSGGTKIATTTKTVTINIDITQYHPTVSLSSITPGTTPIAGYLIAGNSTASVPYSSNKPSGATSITINFSAENGTMATSSTSVASGSVLTNTLPANESSNYTLTVRAYGMDSRGAPSTIVSQTATVYAYKKPTITATAMRVASNGSTTEDGAGTYVYINYSAAVGASVNGQNTIQSVKCVYNGVNYSSPSWVSLSADNSGVFTFTATDRVSSVSTAITVPMARYALDLYDDGTAQHLGVGLAGAIAEADKVKSAKDVYAPNFHGTLDGSATSATTATNANKVKVTNNAFTSTLTSYYPTIVTGTATDNYDENLNENIRFQHQTGTASTPGQDILTLGNSTGSGTAGNQEGRIRLFSQSTGYVYIRPTLTTTGTKNIYLPTTTGTLQLAPTVVWTGTLLGGNSQAMSLSSYSRLKIYAQLSGQSLIFEMDITQASANTSADGAFTADDKYRCSGTYAYWSASRVEVHYAEVGVNSAKSTLYFRRAGYTYGTTYDNNRNNTATYYIYKVEGFV